MLLAVSQIESIVNNNKNSHLARKREHFLGKKRRIVQIQHGWLDSAYIWDTVPHRSIFRIQDFQDWFFSWNYQTCVTYCVLRREKSSSSHCTSICNSVGIVSLEAHSRAETVWCHEHGEKTPFLHTSTEKKMVVVRWPVNFTSNWLQFCWQMEIGVVAACRPCGGAGGCTIHQCSK